MVPLFGAENSLVNTSHSPFAKMQSVGLADVKWTDGFWADWFAVCRDSMVPNMWRLLEDDNISHSFGNFKIAAGLQQGEHQGPPWHDGDFYKWFESLVSTFAQTGDKELEKLMDEIIPIIAKCQREDGYIHTPVIIQQRQNLQGAREFQDRLHFETYNMGHLMTAACLHYRVTGKTTLLTVARRAADFLYDFYKKAAPELARNAICPSHYMGVVEMYRTTKEPRYFELAKNLIEIRDLVENGTDHNQDRIPFRQQTKAIGHAVRANYLYAGVADVFIETGDSTLLKPLELIWNDLVNTKLYITGGCGALYDGVSPDGTSYQPSEIQQVHQAYGRDYQLPNETAHNETCANIGNVLWNWRMLLATGEARFADILELSLYNSVLSGISLNGKRYFYTNPLRVSADIPYQLRWSRERETYISCFCCPPNVVRSVAEANNYAYTLSAGAVWVNLYGANSLKTKLPNGDTVEIDQSTDYPWDGKVLLALKEFPQDYVVKLRIPGWCKNAEIRVNGKLMANNPPAGQYVELKRSWQQNDVIELDMVMPARLVQANHLVEEVYNQVAVMRGPIVYCLESADLPQGVCLSEVAIPADIDFIPEDLFIGTSRIKALVGQALVYENDDSKQLYRELDPADGKKVEVRLIPYYAWGNRGKGEMSVWLALER